MDRLSFLVRPLKTSSPSIMTIERIEPGRQASGLLGSRGVAHGAMLYFYGLCAPQAGDDVFSQASALLHELDGLLEAAGSDKTRVLTVHIHIADVAQFADLNRAWNAWVDPRMPPARACVQAVPAQAGALVEMSVTAVR